MSYVLLNQFRNTFEGKIYRHRNSSLGDAIARCLPEDLYNLGRSSRFCGKVDAQQGVIDTRNVARGFKNRRGDGLFGEIVPRSRVHHENGYVVARGEVATVEIGTEVKILSNSMNKQIDRVINDLNHQVQEFKAAGGTPITVGIVGINHADRYTSYEGEDSYPTGESGKRHPIQEAAEAERRLEAKVKSTYDEFLILRYRARNEPPFDFSWLDSAATMMDYGAILARIARKYDQRF